MSRVAVVAVGVMAEVLARSAGEAAATATAKKQPNPGSNYIRSSDPTLAPNAEIQSPGSNELHSDPTSVAVVSPVMWKIKRRILPVDEVHDQPAALAGGHRKRHEDLHADRPDGA